VNETARETVRFTTEVSLGSILTILSIIITLYIFHTRNIARFARLEMQVKAMWRHFVRQRRDELDDDNDSNNC
jgi:hypothetical protein